MVVGLDVGQRRGQTDGSEGQMGGKVGFRVNCRVWGDESCCGESWCQSMCKAVANSIVDADFADVFAFEDMIAKNINDGATCTNWLVGGRV